MVPATPPRALRAAYWPVPLTIDQLPVHTASSSFTTGNCRLVERMTSVPPLGFPWTEPIGPNDEIRARFVPEVPDGLIRSAGPQ